MRDHACVFTGNGAACDHCGQSLKDALGQYHALVDRVITDLLAPYRAQLRSTDPLEAMWER